MIYYEWLPGRKHLQYQHYLFTHVGDASSFGFRNQNSWQQAKGRQRPVPTDTAHLTTRSEPWYKPCTQCIGPTTKEMSWRQRVCEWL